MHHVGVLSGLVLRLLNIVRYNYSPTLAVKVITFILSIFSFFFSQAVAGPPGQKGERVSHCC